MAVVAHAVELQRQWFDNTCICSVVAMAAHGKQQKASQMQTFPALSCNAIRWADTTRSVNLVSGLMIEE